MADPIEDTPNQKAALAIADTLEDGEPGLWPYINPGDLANSLRERILNPAAINQRSLPACAPAAVAFDLAQNNPRLYAEVIVGLYRRGVADLPRGGKLAVSRSLMQVNYNQHYVRSVHGRQPAADWILLTSIRNSESWGNAYWGVGWPLGWISGATLPSTFEKWLRDFGYTSIIDNTNLVVTKDVLELTDASNLFDQGWRVFLFLNSQCLHKNEQSKSSIFPNHYVALMSKVNLTPVVNTGGMLSLEAMLSDNYVSFVCATYGKATRVPEDANVRLTGSDFSKNFYGYIAARN